MILKRILLTVTLSVLVLTSAGFPFPAQAQTATPPLRVRQLFNTMTPEERVGQLFLVTFTGTETSQQSQIYDLIANHHIGGVVLSAANDNFAAAPNTVNAAYQLIQTCRVLNGTAHRVLRALRQQRRLLNRLTCPCLLQWRRMAMV